MQSLAELRKTTSIFFYHYWNPENGTVPTWSNPWEFEGSIPNRDMRGCYALFKNDGLVYIGVAIGKVWGPYEGAGLSARLKTYWQYIRNDNDKTVGFKASGRFPDITGIRTIGFVKEHYWLAAALEIYLISELSPPYNQQHKK